MLERLLEGLRGQVIEVGSGNGVSFSHYPFGVDEVLAVEPNALYRRRAVKAAAMSYVPIEVVPGHANSLPAPNASKDGAVISLLLCTVASPAEALAELHRVLRPGGELRFYEHVRADRPFPAWMQDTITPLWQRCFRGCHPNRDAVSAIEEAGFEIVAIIPFMLSWARFGPIAPRVIGRAIRPESAR
ncbi:class I SAM-dependent methyltransferase [Saccharopolyspora sp. K220]|nr:class I SAM-dependent methyltransferase [Saccharopolyspora soli]